MKPDDRGRDWARRSRQLFNERAEAVSLQAIQGCVLLGNLVSTEGDTAQESLYGAQAIRMVQLLGLPHRQCSDIVQRETEIRGKGSK